MAIEHAHQYPQVVGTPSERSDRDLWNHINRYIWGKTGAESSPVGDWSAEPYARMCPLPRVQVEVGFRLPGALGARAARADGFRRLQKAALGAPQTPWDG